VDKEIGRHEISHDFHLCIERRLLPLAIGNPFEVMGRNIRMI
jgi:hypothetical protein